MKNDIAFSTLYEWEMWKWPDRESSASRRPYRKLGELWFVDPCPLCRNDCYDIDRVEDADWIIVCDQCGVGLRVPALAGHLKPRDDFEFTTGRCKGMGLDEASYDHLWYVEWAAKEHPSEAVRKKCSEWLLTYVKPLNRLQHTGKESEKQCLSLPEPLASQSSSPSMGSQLRFWD